MSGQTTRYGGVDAFRLAAALMVIAIHTAPFASTLPALGTVFTYGIFRLAVPFFFLCTGYFPGNVGRQTLKLARLYLLATLMYMPLILLAGPFHPLDFLYKLLWQGTFYHLWYFPAAILGLFLAAFASRFLPRPLAGVLMVVLYCLGLAGDNYLPLAETIPCLTGFANGLVSLFGFTRNGIFFAAPFIYAGMVLRRSAARKASPAKRLVFLFGAATLGIAIEALVLQGLSGAVPGGSLYICLPLAACTLLCLLLRWPAPVPRRAGQVAMLVYILHPWCIAVLYTAAGSFGIPDSMQTHSGLFFLFTTAASLLLSCLCALCASLWGAFRHTPPRAVARVDLAALRHNLAEMRVVLPGGCDIIAVVKADAYGHGAAQVSRALRRQGVRRFAVATLWEGVSLRLQGLCGEILVLGRVPAGLALPAFAFRLTLTVVDEPHWRELRATGLPLKVQLKIDTGMHRLGMPPSAARVAVLYNSQRPLRVKGIFSHLATADSPSPRDTAFAKNQADEFFALVETLRRAGIEPGLVHLQSSYGVLNHPAFTPKCNCVRVGLALYGATGADTVLKPRLLPVLSLHSRVVQVKDVQSGSYVGYSHAWHCHRDSRIAIVSIGYADGLPRSAAGGTVLLAGHMASIVATCMDTCLVDVTHIPSLTPGAEATLLGREGAQRVQAVDLARAAGTIPNEVLSRIGGRVRRIYTQKSGDA